MLLSEVADVGRQTKSIVPSATVNARLRRSRRGHRRAGSARLEPPVRELRGGRLEQRPAAEPPAGLEDPGVALTLVRLLLDRHRDVAQVGGKIRESLLELLEVLDQRVVGRLDRVLGEAPRPRDRLDPEPAQRIRYPDADTDREHVRVLLEGVGDVGRRVHRGVVALFVCVAVVPETIWVAVREENDQVRPVGRGCLGENLVQAGVPVRVSVGPVIVQIVVECSVDERLSDLLVRR